MFIGFVKTVFIFYRLTVYYFLSFQKKTSVHILKQQFSIETLKILGFQLQVFGRPALKPKLILVGNHISFLDILVVLAIHPESVFLAKTEVEKWPIIGTVAKKIGTLFIVRDSKRSRGQVKEQIEHILNSSISSLQIAGFPSGTTTLNENKEWKKGLFEIAKLTATTLQPFKIQYSHLRECAYIENDQLFSSLIKLFAIPNKKIYFSWGQSFVPENIIDEISRTRSWTQYPTEISSTPIA